MGDRIPGALGYAAEAMDVTRAKLIDLIEQGKVDAAEFLPKFVNVLSEKTKSGLPAALNKTFTAAGRLKNAFQSFVDVLFRSGVDKLFGTILNIFTRLFTIAKPFVALFGSALFTILRNLLTPIEFILTLIADVIKLIQYAFEKMTGMGFYEFLQGLGTIIGHIVSVVFGAVSGIVKGIASIFSRFEKLGDMFKWFGSIWDDIVQAIRKALDYMPFVNTAAKAVAPAGRQLGKMGSKITPETIEHTARGGAAINALRSGGQAVYVNINKKNGTDKLIDARVEGATSGKMDTDSRE